MSAEYNWMTHVNGPSDIVTPRRKKLDSREVPTDTTTVIFTQHVQSYDQNGGLALNFVGAFNF